MSTRQGGFTLIEVVVAFAILALSLAALYRSFAVTLRGGARVERREHALLLAQSLLARVGRDLRLEVGRVQGHSEDGLDWVIEISSYPPPKPELPWRLPAYNVAVSVNWGAGEAQRLSLNSLELGAQP